MVLIILIEIKKSLLFDDVIQKTTKSIVLGFKISFWLIPLEQL